MAPVKINAMLDIIGILPIVYASLVGPTAVIVLMPVCVRHALQVMLFRLMGNAESHAQQLLSEMV